MGHRRSWFIFLAFAAFLLTGARPASAIALRAKAHVANTEIGKTRAPRPPAQVQHSGLEGSAAVLTMFRDRRPYGAPAYELLRSTAGAPGALAAAGNTPPNDGRTVRLVQSLPSLWAATHLTI